ncbi:TetR/AcrR family transcriptional regulator [Bradyrhizobium sp.]|uniref:TetR/AcrR family transcriptional regulator n=1 Tax=Bradyrhizobium sp. TaxID=376 RepID=UPI003C33DB88
MAGEIKQRMIERTAVLLAKKGLQGTSFSEVLEASGAPRGSLYHHFPGGKDELVLAALNAAGDQAMAVLDGLAGKPATEVTQAFIGLWRLVLTKSDFAAGCAVVAVTVAADSPALLGAAAEVFRTWRSRLGGLLAQGGVPADRALALSTGLISACEGAVILSRAERSFEPFDLVAAEQQRAVQSAITGGC